MSTSSPPPLHPHPPPPASNWTFTQGLILGQASVLLLGLLFVRYVVFSPADQVDSEEYKVRRSEKQKKAMLSATPVPPPVPSQILKKTEYEMATHPPESADWLNVLAAQVIQGYRNDLLAAAGEEGARQRIEKWLNPEGGKQSWLDPIEVTALNLGNSYPLLSNARIRPSDGQGHIRAEIDVDFLDSVSLNLQTSVLINFPKPRFAVLPVALGVELVSLGGTLSLDIHDPVDQRQHLHACLLPDFHLNLKTSSLLGSRAKLQDIPKLEQLIISRIRGVVQDRFVYPHHVSVGLPRLLSPMVSPMPIINDIGESAMSVMGDSIKQGFGRMVQDFTDTFNGDLINPPSPNKSPNGMHPIRTTSPPPLSPVSPNIADTLGRPSSPPTSPSRPARKITMPAGFPHANGNFALAPPTGISSEDSTPVVTPGVSRDVSPLIRRTHLPPGSEGGARDMGMPLGMFAQPPGPVGGASATTSAYQHSQRPIPARGPSASTSSTLPYAPRQPPSRANGSTVGASSYVGGQPRGASGANGNDEFRFRGQFSSQPNLSSVPPVTPAPDRRVGAFNSRT